MLALRGPYINSSLTQTGDTLSLGRTFPLSHLVEPLRWRQNLEFAGDGEMRFTQRTQETEAEKLERLQREREQMRLAIASYTGPVTRCPTGKSTSDPYGFGKHRRPPRTRARNGDGR